MLGALPIQRGERGEREKRERGEREERERKREKRGKRERERESEVGFESTTNTSITSTLFFPPTPLSLFYYNYALLQVAHAATTPVWWRLLLPTRQPTPKKKWHI